MTTTWRYQLPALPDGSDSWSIVFIDSTGCVAVLSDYGTWCFRWVTAHTGFPDFRQFFESTGPDYVAGKFGMGKKEELQVYDGQETFEKIREHIRTERRAQRLSHEDALREWEIASSVEDDIVGFYDWYRETSFESAHEFAVYRMSYGLKHWVTVALPRLQELLRKELEAEK